MSNAITLEDTLDTSDKGDDVQSRFRFQNTYTAMLCCGLLSQNAIEAIYCEHHEDLLIKLANGLYVGVQVKTRQLSLPPFDFSDPQIQHSIGRFLLLDLKFQRVFKSFFISSNHGFGQKLNNNLKLVVQLARDGNKIELLRNRSVTKRCINELAKTCSCSIDEVISLLAKIELRAGVGNLETIKYSLIKELENIETLAEQRLGVLNSIAEGLITMISSAASKGGESLCESFLIGKDVEKEEQRQIIENKKIVKKLIDQLVFRVLDSPLSHFLRDEQSLFGKAVGSLRMEKKMDAGGLSSSNIGLMKDYKYSLESLIVTDMHRIGPERAKGRYNQLQLITNTECQEAYDLHVSDDLFGRAMLQTLREKFRKRIPQLSSELKGFEYEHFLGMTAVLTEDCKIWWSTHFKI